MQYFRTSPFLLTKEKIKVIANVRNQLRVDAALRELHTLLHTSCLHFEDCP